MRDYLLYKADGSYLGKLRTDAVSSAPANFDISEIKDSNHVIVDSLVVNGNFFRRLPKSWASFINFCIVNNLKVIERKSNGDNVVIVNYSQYSVVSATGSTKTLLVASDVTAAFSAGDILKVYNPDGSVYATLTHVSDSYGAPNTSIVVAESFTDIGASSGKYIVNLGH